MEVLYINDKSIIEKAVKYDVLVSFLKEEIKKEDYISVSTLESFLKAFGEKEENNE